MSPDKFLNLLLPPTYLYKVFTRVIKCHNHWDQALCEVSLQQYFSIQSQWKPSEHGPRNPMISTLKQCLQHKSCNTMGNTARNERYDDRLWYFHHNKTTCFIHTICYISGYDVYTYHYIYLAEFYQVCVLIFYSVQYNGYYTPKGFKSLSPMARIILPKLT